jgi:hypothetical protein
LICGSNVDSRRRRRRRRKSMRRRRGRRRTSSKLIRPYTPHKLSWYFVEYRNIVILLMQK